MIFCHLIYFKLYIDYFYGAFESFLKPKNLIIVVIAWKRATHIKNHFQE